MKNNEILTVEPSEESHSQIYNNPSFTVIPDLDLLKDALLNKNLMPIPKLEFKDFLKGIPIELKALLIPMITFYDLKLSDFPKIKELDLNYLLGFNKDWANKEKIEKIYHLKGDSIRAQLIVQNLDEVIESICLELINPYENLAFMDLLFSKPYPDTVKKENKPSRSYLREKEFLEDHEYRYIPIPDGNSTLPLLTTKNLNDLLYANEDQEIDKFLDDLFDLTESFSLSFDYSDLKYIIVPNEEEKDELLNFIENELEDLSELEKLELAQKIIIMENLK